MEDLPVILIRFALYADLMVLAGMTAFSLYALTNIERAQGILPMTLLARLLSALGLVLSGIGLLAMVASMTGGSLWSPDYEVLREIVGGTEIGTAWVVRMVALSVALVVSLRLGLASRFARPMLLVASLIAVVTLVWTGHAGASEGATGTFHRLSDALHMVAAAIWMGGIAAFVRLVFASLPPEAQHQPAVPLATLHRALEQFARIGTFCVTMIVATGIANGLILFGIPAPGEFIATRYGQLLLVKLVLFALMLSLAAINRWRLAPAIGSAGEGGQLVPALRNLRRSLLVEGAAALAVLALVAWLGTMQPPAT